MDNIAVRYCQDLGYKYISGFDHSRNKIGYCQFPDKTKVEVWDFFQGLDGQQYSLCARKGYLTESRKIKHATGYITQEAVCTSEPKRSKSNRRTEINLLQLFMSEYSKLLSLDSRRINKKTAALYETTESTKSILPFSFDWRNQDSHSYIGPIRDQGACGDCYAFGAAAAAESSYNIKHHMTDENTIDFSESYIAWCLGTYGPYREHFSGCNGADYEYAELIALTHLGVTQESYFPYIESDPESCTHMNDPVNIFSGWGRIQPNYIEGIKNAILNYGALDAAILAPPDFIMYTGGIYSNDDTECTDGAYTPTNHSVALVGWGNDSKFGEFWILRNSWGVGWGENGYMKIAIKTARVACSTAFIQYSPPINTNISPSLILLIEK
ncbi:MAG: C1 family peptidase [Desulfobulbaceae bacterium]